MVFGASGNLHTVGSLSTQNVFQGSLSRIWVLVHFRRVHHLNPGLDFRPISVRYARRLVALENYRVAPTVTPSCSLAGSSQHRLPPLHALLPCRSEQFSMRLTTTFRLTESLPLPQYLRIQRADGKPKYGLYEQGHTGKAIGQISDKGRDFRAYGEF
jgi:hypothetical protein